MLLTDIPAALAALPLLGFLVEFDFVGTAEALSGEGMCPHTYYYTGERENTN